MDIARDKSNLHHPRSLREVLLMSLRRSAITGLLTGLLVSGACAAYQDTKPQPKSKPESEKHSKFRQDPSQELVPVTIRMPDGRVIVRMEPRNPSRIDPDSQIATNSTKPALGQNGEKSTKGRVDQTGGDVTGGSNGTSGAMTKAGGSTGSGGGGARGPHGGSGSSRSDAETSLGTGDGPPASLSRPSTENPVQPDMDFKVRIYTWDMTGGSYPNLQLAVKVAPWRGRSPSQLAAIVARDVNNSHHDKVVLRFWKEFIPAARNPFDYTSPRELIASGGFDAGLREYWRDFAIELKNLDIKPDYLIFDMEEGIRFWEIPEEARHNFFAQIMDPERPWLQSLPASMRSITVDQFMDRRNRVADQARRDYYEFAEKFRADFMADIFGGAFEAAYGEPIPMSNYRNIIPTFDTYGTHGEIYPAVSIAGISAPQMYIAERDVERFERLHNTTKSSRWNDFIDGLNRARSAAASGVVTPWISGPGFGVNNPSSWDWVYDRADLDAEYWLWDTLMGHLTSMGIDTYIAWNPGPEHNNAYYSSFAEQTDQHMEQWLAAHPRVMHQLSRNLPPIPLDADRIETNGFVTTYDEFLAVFRED